MPKNLKTWKIFAILDFRYRLEINGENSKIGFSAEPKPRNFNT